MAAALSESLRDDVHGHRAPMGVAVNTRRPVKFKFPVNTGFLVRVSHTLLALRIICVYLELERNGARATGWAARPARVRVEVRMGKAGPAPEVWQPRPRGLRT